MKNKPNPPLFSVISDQAASQTNGGHYYVSYYQPYPVVVYRPAYYPYSVPRNRAVNITNLDVDDGAIVNLD